MNRQHRWRPVGTREERGYGLAHVRIRRALLKAEPNCRLCAAEGKETKATHADHIKAKCFGGSNEQGNYQPLCAAHSRSKSGREGALMRAIKRRLRKEAQR